MSSKHEQDLAAESRSDLRFALGICFITPVVFAIVVLLSFTPIEVPKTAVEQTETNQ